MSTSGFIWVILGVMMVAISKYVASIRLRGLADRMQRDHHDAGELRFRLAQAAEKGSQLSTETNRLKSKVMALRNAVASLEKSLQAHSVSSITTSRNE